MNLKIIKKNISTLLILCLLFSTKHILALSGEDIMNKNDDLPKPKTTKGYSILIIIKGGNQERKEFKILGKKYGLKTRLRISFVKPTKIELLTHSQYGKDDLQWLKLSSGTVRKIASSDKNSSFVNSHFYYEDIGDKDVDDFSYEYLDDTSVDDEPCYKVKAVKKKGTKVYSKQIIYVKKSNFVILRVHFYENGIHTKTLRNEKIEIINGIYTPKKVVMEKYKNGKLLGKSLLYIKSIQYNIGVSDQLLKRESL